MTPDDPRRDEIAADRPEGIPGEGAKKDEVTPPEDDEAGKENEGDQASEESFPASDPPSW